jgi:pyrroline-5-carboxylate reductase
MSDGNLHIGFIGGGNMARAIIGGLLEAGHDPGCLSVAEPDAQQRDKLRALHDELHISHSNAEVAELAETLVLAVKPQILATVLTDLRQVSRPAGQVVVSIAAGISLSTLEVALTASQPIVRIMPNQPALVGAGMSVLIGNATVGGTERERAQRVAEAIGQSVWIEDESLMDAVTAVSGSGPAYFYLLMEIMESCAREMGLPEKLAATLTRQTGFGAGRVAVESALDLRSLRESVTSKGGTTAAAIDVLENARIRDIFARALEAARDRSTELGTPGEMARHSEKE